MTRAPPRPLAVAGALFVGALLLRLATLGAQSLWADEGVTWWYSTHGSWKDTLYAEPNHPPGWYLLTRAWLAVFPASEASLRMPAAILGALSVVLAWRLARRLSSDSVALGVALFAAVNPFWIAESQEARMYAALLAVSLGTTLLYLRWRDTGSRRTAVAYAALAALSLYTHYYALWPLIGHGAHAIWVWRSTRAVDNAIRCQTPIRGIRPGGRLSPLPIVLAHVAAGLAFLPWFLHLRGSFRGIGGDPIEPAGRLFEALWRMGAGPGIAALDAARYAAGPGGALRADPVRVAIAAALWFVPIAFGVRAVLRERTHRALLATSLVLPIVAVVLVALRWPLVHERYLVFLAPWLLWLAVTGALSVRGAARAALLGGLVLLHVAGLLGYEAGDREPVRTVVAGGVPYEKESWREAHLRVASEAPPGTVVLIHARFLYMVWDFYDRLAGVPAQPLPPRLHPPTAALSAEAILEAVPGLRDARRVFLVGSHEATRPRGHYEAAVLEALRRAWGAVETHEESLPAQKGIRILRVVRDAR